MSGRVPRTGGMVANITDANEGYFFGVTIAPHVMTAQTIVSVANRVLTNQFVLPFQVTVRTINTQVTTLEAAKKYSVGIYSADGNTLLVDSGAISTASTGVKSVTITAVTLIPGVYLFAHTADGTTAAAQKLNMPNVQALMNGGSASKANRAANASSAGVLPATLGTLTEATARLPVAALFSP